MVQQEQHLESGDEESGLFNSVVQFVIPGLFCSSMQTIPTREGTDWADNMKSGRPWISVT